MNRSSNGKALSPCALALGVAVCYTPALLAQHTPLPGRFDFGGKLLLIPCDGDMLPSAYIDGKLGPAASTGDVLSIVRLGTDPDHMRVSTVPVTNSVTGPPAAVTVTPDGRYAVVAETQGPRPAGKPDARMTDLAPGRKLSVIDLADPDHPSMVQQLASHERAVSVAFSADGTVLVAAFAPAGKTAEAPLAFFHFHAGRLDPFAEPSLPGFSPGDSLVDAEFVPGKQALALLFTGKQRPRLALFHLAGTGPKLSLQPWANEVAVDASPFLVRFSPDGRFALINSMEQNRNHRGTVTSIALAGDEAAAPAQHRIVSLVEAGELPEGLAVSPDGRWVATANLEESFEPLADSKQQFFASLSLLQFNSANGLLTRVGDFPFDGALPEPIVFDNSSRFLAAASFARYEDPAAGGALHFWRIAEHNPQPGRIELVELDQSVPLPRGPQSIAIVR